MNKEFNKWFDETFPLPPTIERGPIGRDLKSKCKQAWEASCNEKTKELEAKLLLAMSQNYCKICGNILDGYVPPKEKKNDK